MRAKPTLLALCLLLTAALAEDEQSVYSDVHRPVFTYKHSDIKTPLSRELAKGLRKAPVHELHVGARVIDTIPSDGTSFKDALVAIAAESPDETRLYVVQVKAGSSKDAFAQLERAGDCVVGGYVPHNGYYMRIHSAKLMAVAQLQFVVWVEPVHPEDKITAELAANLHTVKQLRIVTFKPALDTNTPANTADTAATLNSLAEPCKLSQHNRRTHMYSLSCDAADSSLLASAVNKLTHSAHVLHVLASGGTAAFANYKEAWAAQTGVPRYTPISVAGLDGSGEIVGIGDTGLDTEACFFADSERGGPSSDVDYDARKVIAYNKLRGERQKSKYGHGSHVAATVAGSVEEGEGWPEGAAMENGLAPGAQIYFTDLWEPLTNSYEMASVPDVDAYFEPMYDAGARVSVNAWGVPLDLSRPNVVEFDVDDFSYKNPHFLAIFPAGNSGRFIRDTNTIYTPGTAKNALTVGATRVDVGEDGMASHGLAAFNSRGPTVDGRYKPEIFAPGVNVASLNPKTGSCEDMAELSGTSMATAVVGGLALQVRQYFREGWYPSGEPTSFHAFNPTAALVKAVLINSARPVNHRFDREGRKIKANTNIPTWRQGFGRVELANALPTFPKQSDLFVHEATLFDGGGNYDFDTFCFKSTSAVGPLRVTLVWTDPTVYSSGASTILLSSDLDLVVTDSKGVHRSGNGFISHSSQGVFRETDTHNNVEDVYIESPGEGTVFTVTVVATRVPYGVVSQPYSLVVSGHFKELDPTTSPCSSPCSASTCVKGQCIGGVCRCDDGGDEIVFGGADCSHEYETLYISDLTTDDISYDQVVAEHSWMYYRFGVLSTYPELQIEMRRTSGSGDPDMYIKFGEFPTLTDYDDLAVNCDPCGDTWSLVTLTEDTISANADKHYVYIGVFGYCCDQATFDLLVHTGYFGVLSGVSSMAPSVVVLGLVLFALL